MTKFRCSLEEKNRGDSYRVTASLYEGEHEFLRVAFLVDHFPANCGLDLIHSFVVVQLDQRYTEKIKEYGLPKFYRKILDRIGEESYEAPYFTATDRTHDHIAARSLREKLGYYVSLEDMMDSNGATEMYRFVNPNSDNTIRFFILENPNYNG